MFRMNPSLGSAMAATALLVNELAWGAHIPMMSANTVYYLPQANIVSMMHVNVEQGLARQAVAESADAAPSAEPSRGEQSRDRDQALLDRELVFKSSPAVSREVKARLTDHIVRTKDAEAGRKLQQVLGHNDVVGNFNRLLGRYGYSGQNFADVLTAFTVMSWEIVNGRDATAPEIKGVNRQVRGWVAGNGRIRRLPDRDKQSLAEEMVYQVSLGVASKNQLVKSGDDARLAQLREAVAASLAGMGLDVSRLALTDRGFEPRAR